MNIVNRISASGLAVALALQAAGALALDFDMDTTTYEGKPLLQQEVEVHIAQPTTIKDLFPVEAPTFAPMLIGRLEKLQAASSESLEQQIQQSGLSFLSAFLLATPQPNDPNLSLLWNQMKFHLNEYNRSGVLDITTQKTYTDPVTGQTKTFQYRWVIAIRHGGLRSGPRNPVGSNNWTYFARGDDIEVLTFQVNGKNVEYYTPNGVPNALAKVYAPNSNDCIIIKTTYQLPPDGITPVGTPTNMFFCAGSCSGFLMATK